jgi:hypothetical protein
MPRVVRRALAGQATALMRMKRSGGMPELPSCLVHAGKPGRANHSSVM